MMFGMTELEKKAQKKITCNDFNTLQKDLLTTAC